MNRKRSATRPDRQSRNRLLLMEEAARMMIEDGVRNTTSARRKAASRLGIPHRSDWPDESEIETACARRMSLFAPDSQRFRDEKLDCAEDGLALLADFSPRLAGQLVRGPILRNSLIEIHVFADTLEDVLALLETRQLAGKLSAKTFYYRPGTVTSIPAIELEIDSHEVEISVFAVDDIRKKPLSSGQQKPVTRLSLSQLRMRRAAANSCHER